MTSANMTTIPDRTLASGGMVLVYAMVIGFTDNFVRVIAADGGLWQFHATRSVMAWALLLALMIPFGLRLKPVLPRADAPAIRLLLSGRKASRAPLAILPGLTLHDILARCDVVTAGVDGGGLDDLLGLGVLGRDRETREWLAWAEIWRGPAESERSTTELLTRRSQHGHSYTTRRQARQGPADCS